LETDWIGGYQIKGGANFRLSDDLDLYGNLGYVSKVPIFDAVIDDGSGTKAEDPKNETFTHIEFGANQKALNGRLSLKAGFYYTIWNDRTSSRGVQNADGSEGLIFLTGMDQTHMGFEVEAAYQPVDMLRFDLAAMIASWKHTDDVNGRYRDYSSAEDTEYYYSVKDLYIGDAPQAGGTLGISVFPVEGLTLSLIGAYYLNHYAAWDPFSRAADPDDPATADRDQ
jgi:outer membrane receptor protein involved in Fe transport